MRSSNKIVSRWIKIVIAVILILLVFALSSRAFEFGREVFTAAGTEAAPGTDRIILIPEGAGRTEVAGILKENGLIENKSVFLVQTMIYEAEFFPGEYILNTSWSSEEIIDKLRASDNS